MALRALLHRLIAVCLLLAAAQVRAADAITAYTEDFPPYNFTDAHGQLAGYSVELLGLLMAKAHTDYHIEQVPWARAMGEVRHQPNSLVFTIAKTPERAPDFIWIGPIARRNTSLLGLANHPLTLSSVDDARPLRIGALNGDVGMEQLLHQGFIPGRNLIVENKRNDLIRLLQNGSIDLIVGNAPVFRQVAIRVGLDANELTVRYVLADEEDGYYFALNRATPADTVTRLQRAWAGLQGTDAVAAIKRKYAVP
ncbi:MAG: transporter substrate-binding domain-containing protein [Burkholderiales bacterium]|nr:transporter substrate-binding domain-containing protein [Burkholderiales bacterium]